MKKIAVIFCSMSALILQNNANASRYDNNDGVRHVVTKSVPHSRNTQPISSQYSATIRTKDKNADSGLTQRYILQLKSAPLAKQTASIATEDNQKAHVLKRTEKIEELKKVQHTLVNKLQRVYPELRLHNQFAVLINAIEISASNNTLKQLQALDEVVAIYPVKRRYLNLDASHEVIKSAAAWEIVGGKHNAGKGIKIAIVDTGIREDNPMFRDDGMSAPNLTTANLENHPDYCRSKAGDSDFCNNKLIVARWIVPEMHGMEIYDQEYRSPRGFDGHGTHVAGIAVGQPVNIEYSRSNIELSGVAPGSYLMVYKALYMDPFGSVYGTDTMLLEALEMAVLDGADIINNSWGAGSGEDPDASIYQEVFANAEAMGVLMVNAAGNTGHPGATINCPACIESGIAVANTTHGRFFGHAATVSNTDFHVYEGKNNQLSSDVSSPLYFWQEANTEDLTGCSAIGNPVFDGGIILVAYEPFCPMETVAENVKSAGGDIALLYYAGQYGQATYEPLIPFVADYAIPLFGISQETGLTILESFASGAEPQIATISATTSAAVENQFVDIVNPFSSTGPNNNPNYLKPDMTAPGTNVISAYSPDEFSFPDFPFSANKSEEQEDSSGTFAMLTGTSMAAPHVAGAAAIVKQRFPEWTTQQIKSALMSTSNTGPLLGDDPAGPFEMGAGRLEIINALDASVYFEQVSHSDPACIGTCQFSNRLKNLLPEATTWRLAIEFFDQQTVGEIYPNEFTLAATGENGSETDITIGVDASLANPEHRLYKKWVFGRITATNESGKLQHLPIAIYANDASDAATLLNYSETSNVSTADTAVFTTRIRNKALQEDPSIDITLTANAEFLAGEEQVLITHGETESLHYSEDGRTLHWQGNLRPGLIQLSATDTWDNFLLSEQGVSAIPCDQGCQFVNAVVDFSFIYNGENYQSLTISDNGFVVPGNASYGYLTALFNQRFPSQDNLNNVIAPFWTEFDLYDPNSPGDTGNGSLRAAVRVIDNINYLVIEWDNVALYQLDDGVSPPPFDEPLPIDDETGLDTFTFQLIIEENTDNIWFHYIDIPKVPEALSIGAENSDGTIGQTYHFDGMGNDLTDLVLTSGMSLKLFTQQEGRAEIQYSAALSGPQALTTADVFEIEEDTGITLDVLSNDSGNTHITATAQLHGQSPQKAIFTSIFNSINGFKTDTLALVSLPPHGTAEINDGMIVYSPSADFVGQDTFSYTVNNTDGIEAAETWVTVDVTAINDAPEVTLPLQLNVQEGESIQLLAEANDVDSEHITFVWTQLSGPEITWTGQSAEIVITAPMVEKTESVKLQVVTNDGEKQSAPAIVDIRIQDKRSSGGSVFHLLLFCAVILLGRSLLCHLAIKGNNADRYPE